MVSRDKALRIRCLAILEQGNIGEIELRYLKRLLPKGIKSGRGFTLPAGREKLG